MTAEEALTFGEIMADIFARAARIDWEQWSGAAFTEALESAGYVWTVDPA